MSICRAIFEMGARSGARVQEDVDGEDHQRHGQDHLGDAGRPTSDLADGDDDEPGDHPVDDEFDHARRR